MIRFPAFVTMLAMLAAPAALAQDAAASRSLDIELNALQQSEGGCRITFLAENRLGATIDRAALEIALFRTDGGIDRIVTLDFKALTPGKSKVLQFEIAGLACDELGRLLINDVTACEGEALEPGSCLAGLAASSRPDVTFGT
jgi:hypothetical protein